MYPTSFKNDTTLEYETKFSTNDYITSENRLRLVNDNSALVNMNKSGGNIEIPMEDVRCKVFTLYNRKFVETETNSSLENILPAESDNIFVEYDESYSGYIWTNEYTTGLEPLTFIKPLKYVRSALYFEDYTEKDSAGEYVHDIMDVRMESLPFIRCKLAYDSDRMSTFMNTFTTQYENISSIIDTRLRNETSIDVKLYNTYGRSTNYYIGEDETLLNTLNLRIAFDMWFNPGTDTTIVIPEIKRFIKERIETISDNGTNQIHISNLMREIEHNFSYIDHIRFKGFNGYDTDHQSIKLKHTDIDDMSKEERRKYVPELLVIDLDDIVITEYTA
jgi:hypothetical protein